MRLCHLLPVALLAAFAAMALGSMSHHSITGDEVTHLPSGYTYLKTGEFRLNLQHPPLIKALAGLPLLFLDLKPVEDGIGWKKSREWVFGRDFLTNNREPLERIVFVGRLPMIAVGLLLGAVLYLWARELWGAGAGLFVLLLYCFCPNFLAHTQIVHTDVGVAAFSLLAVYMLWKLVRTARWRYVLACGVALGLALLAKYSGVVTVLTVAALLAVAAWQGPSAQLEEQGRSRLGWTLLLTASAMAIALLALAVVALGFGLGNYHRGYTLIHADANPHWEAFLWGRYSKDGFWYYYLLAQLWKTPLPTLICFAAAVLLVPLRAKTSRLDWWFVLLPLVAFHGAGMWQRPSIGVRHVLPAFPFLFLACGATAWWVGRRGALVKAAFGLLCVWLVAATLGTYPHFLPYFNALAGGPQGGIRYLDDSNVDWGQEFYDLKHYVDERRPAEPRMLLFEPLPRSQYGIDAQSIKLEDAVWPQPGLTYFVSRSYLQRNSLFDDYPGIKFDWLERYRDVDQIGWAIGVYRFSTDPVERGDPSVFYVPVEEWYANAIRSLNDVLSRYPSFDYPRVVLAGVKLHRARWLEEQQRGDEALLDYLAAARLASAAEYRQAFRDAVLRLGARVSAGAQPPELDFLDAAFHCSDGEDGSCLLALLRCLRKEERHLPARLNLGSLYARLGFLGLARREWEICLSFDPSYAPALQNLARLDSPPRGGNGASGAREPAP